jgi:hypothetical protein
MIVRSSQDQTVNEITAAFSAAYLVKASTGSSSPTTHSVFMEEEAQQRKLSSVICRWCERCKEGMLYIQTIRQIPRLPPGNE